MCSKKSIVTPLNRLKGLQQWSHTRFKSITHMSVPVETTCSICSAAARPNDLSAWAAFDTVARNSATVTSLMDGT